MNEKHKNTVSFDIAMEDLAHVEKIVDRAMKINPDLDRQDLMMDLTATHCNGCELDLDRLANDFDDFNLMHDVYGISAHINRTNGKLERCFLPRSSK